MRGVILTAAAALAALAAFSGAAWAQSAGDRTIARAVIFAYSRFGEDALGVSSLRIDQFEAHLAELLAGGYAVRPLPEIVAALASNTPLPERTIALTIDETHRSVYTEAWPRLRRAGLPFTLFVATDTLDRQSVDAMSWSDLRDMASTPGVTIGSLGASHARLAIEDRAYVLGQMQRAADRLKAELDLTPTLAAYPYGESTPELAVILRQAGYVAAFGQHSGVANSRDDHMLLPRFAMNEAYGGIERFRLAADALPLIVADFTPERRVAVDNPPVIGFTVDALMGSLANLSCFASGVGRAQIAELGSRRIEIRLDQRVAPGRLRVNCTIPTAEGRWRWLGAQVSIRED